MLKARWLNASVEFICSITGSSKRLDLNTPQSTPVRPLRRSRLRRDATGRLYDPGSLYYNYACLFHYYMYMMNLAHVSNTQTTWVLDTQTTAAAPQARATTAKPLEYDGQMPGYFPHYNPYYYRVGNKPVVFPRSFAFDSTTSTGQCPHCSWNPLGKWPPSGPSHPGFLGRSWPLQQIPPQQYYGGYPYQVLPQTAIGDEPYDPTDQNTPPTPSATPATATPCPNQVRPTLTTPASCLEVVSTYIRYENLTFQPALRLL